MSFPDFLRDKFIFIALSLFVSGFGAFLLFMLYADLPLAIFLFCALFIASLLSLIPEYVTKNRYYGDVWRTVTELDKKRFLSEIIDRPDFSEGKFLYDVVRLSGKSANDEIARHGAASLEYREYIELWVHEIKTPIAGAKLICENARNSELADELDKIEFYVEQVLFYARGSNVEKDYRIRRTELEELVKGALRSNARYLIARRIRVQMNDLAHTVFTDQKWIEFILRQLIDNAVKYGCETLAFSGARSDGRVSLYVRDDGAGIPEQDLDRIFEKGFTGENGRRYGRSTGMGLYLCKQLCLKLGMDIAASSRPGEGTTMEIVFPRGEMYF